MTRKTLGELKRAFKDGTASPEEVEEFRQAAENFSRQFKSQMQEINDHIAPMFAFVAEGELPAQDMIEKFDAGNVTPSDWERYINANPPGATAIAWLIMKAIDAGVLQKKSEIETKALGPGRKKGQQTNMNHANKMHADILKINADLLKHPNTARYTLEKRAEYIVKQPGILQVNGKPYLARTVKDIISRT